MSYGSSLYDHWLPSYFDFRIFLKNKIEPNGSSSKTEPGTEPDFWLVPDQFPVQTGTVRSFTQNRQITHKDFYPV